MGPQKKIVDHHKTVSLKVVAPYEFELSLKVVRSFQPVPPEQDNRLRLAARIDSTPVLIEVEQSPGPEELMLVSSFPAIENSSLRQTVEWVLFAELDLTPFYWLVGESPRLEFIVKGLHGLKPMRPASLFEMAVIAITEQQISLAAAHKIRSRIVQRFGLPVNDLWVFPEPRVLASAPLEELRACGLSQQKAGYIHELAGQIEKGTLDIDSLKTMDDDKARETIMGWKGFGRWSADYILVRGLARPDCVPIDDLAIRSVVGEYLGDGKRVTPQEVVKKLAPFRPYRGLLAFYLLANQRLKKALAKSPKI
jgi:DNA-3-methyladenine glycosylase II